MTSETTKLDDFSTGGIWDAEAHVRFLRSSAGASSGFTADLIEQLYSALTATRPDTGDHIAAGKMVGKAGMTNPSETRDSELVASDKLHEILAGCAGVTPGPWQVYDGCSWRRIGTAPSFGRDYDDCAVLYPNVASDGHPDMNAGRGQDTYANLNHIARLDPQTVASIITELLSLREAADTIDRLTPTGEPVGWQWSDFSGNWYTVDTNVSRIPLAEQEQIARAIAKDHEGRVRPVYASPREGHVEVPTEPTEAMIRAGYQERDRPGSGAAVSGIYRAMIRAALPHNQGETKP